MSEDLHRLFFALWPTDELRAQIERDTHAAVVQAGGRPIPAANFHITLVFLGEVSDAQMNAARASAEAISHGVASAKFTLTLNAIESWTGADVLVFSGECPPPQLGMLVDRLRISLLHHEFKLQRQTFKPHVTLVRKLPRRMAKEPAPPLRWAVEDFVLVESRPLPAGSEYTVAGRWPLA